mmetsp:Transcript_43962/g.116186  ORF Transcript_43962/g.116186 Transcript_43962/m.116186 type:complete len:905 (-) Transcript_43962:120-2834(-)
MRRELRSAGLLFSALVFDGALAGDAWRPLIWSSSAVIQDGGFRFTAVTDRLIRIEYDEDSKFVDERTIAFLRTEPKGVWQQSARTGHAPDGWTVLNTSSVSVGYTQGPPSPGSVVITSRSDPAFSWTWGDDPAYGNLRGTARTLDSGAETLDLNCNHKVSPTMENSEMHCTWGLISRSGWAVVNDTGAPVIKDRWFAPSRNTLDVSVFMHGLDYSGAMLDFYYAAGPPALPPRYALGTMFTRWFNFDSDSVMSIIEDFESRSMPLDAWIFDMNWHIYGPWGAFTWNEHSFPRLQKLLGWLKEQGLPVGANTHDHDGIRTSEKTYKEVCEALGCDSGKDIPFDLYNKTFALAQEDIAMRALDSKDGKQGIDFSWIDYQQGEVDTFQQTTIPHINPTIVLNMLRSNDPVRHHENRRSMILSRWGGLGNHRYPVGFSGDQNHDWKGLAYLPYFTSTAANVGFNYWSHDTVGGGSDLSNDYELSVRWTQVSAWSPVLRFHDKGEGTGTCATTNSCARIVPWDLPNAFFKAVRSAAQDRDELMPYIYTAAWSSASTGHALCRPMYYENPMDSSLYDLNAQYLFGPDMIISPITSPSSDTAAAGFQQALGASEWSVVAPGAAERGWVDRLNGDFFNGMQATSTYGIHDVPGLVREGAVIPMRPRARGESSLARAAKPFMVLEFRIAPAQAFYTGGSISGKAEVVDDDGVTLDYLKGSQSRTVCEYTFEGGKFNFKISQTGDFEGKPSSATIKLSFPQLPPMSIQVPAGAIVDYNRELVGSIATFPSISLSEGFSVEATIDPAFDQVLPNFVGLAGRVRRARYIKDALDDLNTPYGDDRANLTSVVLAATEMSPAFAAALPDLWASAVKQVQALLENNKDLRKDTRRAKFIVAMLRAGVEHEVEPLTEAFV